MNLLKFIPQVSCVVRTHTQEIRLQHSCSSPLCSAASSCEMLWTNRASLAYKGDSRAANRQQYCLPHRQHTGSVLGDWRQLSGALGNVEGGRIQLCTRKDGSSSLLLPFCCFQGSHALPLFKSSRALVSARSFAREFLCICCIFPTELYILFWGQRQYFMSLQIFPLSTSTLGTWWNHGIPKWEMTPEALLLDF